MTPLYAITDPKYLPGERLFSGVREALEGGIKLIQYRDKLADIKTQIGNAKRLLAICLEHNAQLIVNDRIDVAEASAAHGVHLGQTDASLKSAREQLGPNAIIGVTCHDNLGYARTAETNGANYAAFGRFFPSRTKPDASVASLDILKKARLQLHIPIVAIGGITQDTISDVLQYGAYSAALCETIFGEKIVGQAGIRNTCIQLVNQTRQYL